MIVRTEADIANLQKMAVAERREAEPTTGRRNDVGLAVRQATIDLLTESCRQCCCLPNFVRSDRSQEWVDQLRLSERCKILLKERARVLTCANQRLLESSSAADFAPLSSLWTQSPRIYAHLFF